MTQPSKRFDVWRRLYQRFLIEPFPSDGDVGVSTIISPTTDADALLRTTLIAGYTLSLIGSAGTFVNAVTVPDDKLWVVKGLHRAATTAVSQVDMRLGGSGFHFSISATAELYIPINDIRLPEGGNIGMLATADAGDSAINLLAIYEEEEMF